MVYLFFDDPFANVGEWQQTVNNEVDPSVQVARLGGSEVIIKL